MSVTSTNLLLIGRLVAGTVVFAGSHLTVCELENETEVLFCHKKERNRVGKVYPTLRKLEREPRGLDRLRD